MFALGLPGFVLIKMFSPMFVAHEDTTTPTRPATLSLTANTIGSLALFFLFRHLGCMPHLGIAVALTLGGWLSAGLLWRRLRELGYLEADSRLKQWLPKIIACSVFMGLAVWPCAGLPAPWPSADNAAVVRGGTLAVLALVGFATYAVSVIALGAMPMDRLKRFGRRAL